MKKVLSLLLISVSLFADSVSICSNEAFFNGKLVWLKGNVSLDHTIGTLCAQEAKLQRVDEKKLDDFQTIDLYEQVLFSFKEGGKIRCDCLHVDCITQTGVFTGIAQISYQDAQKQVLANTAKLHYDFKENQQVKPTELFLEGHIQLKQSVDSTLQLALADTLEYNIEKQTMVLKATPPKRVLFYDTAKDLKISAPIVKIDQVNENYTIQGLGDVRMSFKKDEMVHLKEFFDWD